MVLLRVHGDAHLGDRHHQEHPGTPGLRQDQQSQPADLAQQHTARVPQRHGSLGALRAAGHPQPLGDQRETHDRVAEPDGQVHMVLEGPRHPGGEDQDTGDLHQRHDPVERVVVVVRRGEPGEVHPRPPDGEEDHRVVEDALARVSRRHGVHQLAARLGDGHDEAQVEEELQRRRDAVRLVPPPGGHSAQGPESGRPGRRGGFGSGAGRHTAKHSRKESRSLGLTAAGRGRTGVGRGPLGVRWDA